MDGPTMTALPRIIAVIGLSLTSALSGTTSAHAQDGAGGPRSRPNVIPNPGQLGAISSPQRFLVTSSANDRGTSLWVIDAVEHTVTLCEKLPSAADFTCNKKALP
jgi:hypothetical protein